MSNQTTAEHPVANSETGECSNPNCPCHEWAQRESTLTDDGDKSALLDLVISRARADLNDGKPLTEIQADDELPPCDYGFPLGVFCAACREEDDAFIAAMVSAAGIRAAMFDVIDNGWQCGKGCDLRHPWAFSTEMFAGDAQPSDDDLRLREKFVDAVCARIAEIQQLPLPRTRDLWRDGYREGLADGLARANADLQQVIKTRKERR